MFKREYKLLKRGKLLGRFLIKRDSRPDKFGNLYSGENTDITFDFSSFHSTFKMSQRTGEVI